jgi:hypothetical protein
VTEHNHIVGKYRGYKQFKQKDRTTVTVLREWLYCTATGCENDRRAVNNGATVQNGQTGRLGEGKPEITL